MDRREWLRGALAGVATSGIGPAASTAEESHTPWFARHHVPVGLQLYTVGDDARKDISTTLQRVAGIGYRTIELVGYHGQPLAALRSAAAQSGVKFTSIHVNAAAKPGEPGLDQDLPRLADDLHSLGVTDVVMPMFAFPERFGAQRQGESFSAYVQRIGQGLTRDDWRRTADLLNDRGGKLRAMGLRFGYHNHNPEFAPLGGTNGLQLLLDNTAPADVVFELDVGWAAAGGVDAVELLQAYPKRFQLMHVKDIRASTRTNYALQQDPSEVGGGNLDWAHVLPAAFAAGVRKFYVEQEPPFATDRYTAIRKSFDFLTAFDASDKPASIRL